MKIFVALVCAVSVFGGTALAQAQDAKQDLMQAMKTLNSAPAYRMTVVSTDTDTKKARTITMESVAPASVHLREEDEGTIRLEFLSDGKTTYLQSGAGKKLELAPPAMSTMFATMRQSMVSDASLEGTTNVQRAGYETIGGIPATIYTAERDAMGLHTTMRLWVSNQDHRPLKSEGDSVGTMNVGNRPGRKVNRHSVTTFDYDPSIKVTLPGGH